MSEDTVKKMDEAYELVKDGTIVTGRQTLTELSRKISQD